MPYYGRGRRLDRHSRPFGITRIRDGCSKKSGRRCFHARKRLQLSAQAGAIERRVGLVSGKSEEFEQIEEGWHASC